MTTAPAATTANPTNITLGDTIVTRHGSNFGTVEIWSIEAAGQTPAGVALVKVTGYQKVNAGICGPWENTYRADEDVQVEVGA